MCPMKIKIKIANFSRVVKFIFGPLKKKPRHYARVFFHSGSCHTSLEQARRVQHKPNRNICPLIGILNGYGQNGHFGLKSSPLVIKCLIPLLLCNILAGIETHIFIETHSVQIFAELKRDL